MIKYVDFEDLMRYISIGYQGTTIQRMVEDLLGSGEPEAEYTVYWPKDSIRVIPGSSYAVACAVLAILSDPRTRHAASPTTNAPAELARVRRGLHSRQWANVAEVGRSTVYALDRLLPWDITASLPFHAIEEAEPNVTYRLDLATLPLR